ncbi:MAG: hypothetical protein ACRDJ9_24555 [Dehalococcoidia bacterium]
MADDLGFDLETILRAVDTADVLVVRFPFFDKRLLIDFRSVDGDPPVIALVPQASGIEDRFRSVKQARPRLPVPERIISFHWPRHAEVMLAAGVWQRIVHRLVRGGQSGLDRRCKAVWDEMRLEERRESMRAIRGGERYETLWQRHEETGTEGTGNRA